MREIVTLAFIIFLFKGLMRIAIQVGPLDRSSSLTAQMTRPRGHHVIFMVSLIRKIGTAGEGAWL